MRICNPLDRCFETLEALEKSGLYNLGELEVVIQKLSSYENKLQRKDAAVQFCISYAAFLQRLEKSFDERKEKAVRCTSTKFNPFMTLILNVYQRGIVQFYNSVEMWRVFLSYLCSRKAHRLVSRALVQALRFNPRCTGLWAYAAMWELRCQLNPVGARALLQRGLRTCSDVPALWRCCFELELEYADSIRKKAMLCDVSSSFVPSLTEKSSLSQGEHGCRFSSHLSEVNGALAVGVYRAAKAQNAGCFQSLVYFLVRARKLEWANQLQQVIQDDLMRTFLSSTEQFALAALSDELQPINVIKLLAQGLSSAELLSSILTSIPVTRPFGPFLKRLHDLRGLDKHAMELYFHDPDYVMVLCENFGHYFLYSKPSQQSKLSEVARIDIQRSRILDTCNYFSCGEQFLRHKLTFHTRGAFVTSEQM